MSYNGDPHPLHVFFTVLFGYTILSPVYKRCVDRLGLTGGEWVLDYGSDSGRIARHIAQRLLTGGGHLTCVDVSPVWMDTTRKRIKKYPNVDFKLGDVAAPDIEDGAYDAVIIHFVLHHVDGNVRVDKVSVLSHKLKARGKLFISQPAREQHGVSAGEIRRVMAAAGFRKSGSRFTRSLMGRVFEGVFEKLT
ncbi:MAG TPA: class I SAM-dependent methyltransferase [Candidatus Acidoferrales bacterium]|nr:class I SAM-dependent methyltransferase [Candidatus Acidoferrales bacterium]